MNASMCAVAGWRSASVLGMSMALLARPAFGMRYPLAVDHSARFLADRSSAHKSALGVGMPVNLTNHAYCIVQGQPNSIIRQ